MKNQKTTYEILEALVFACMSNDLLQYYIWEGDLPTDREKALREAASLIHKWQFQDELNNE